jgi:hypothetical protein
MGERMSYNDAEKAIYRLAASDESRHVAFGVMHLQYLSQTDPQRKEEIHSYLDEIELGLVAGTGGQNPAQRGTPSNAAHPAVAARRDFDRRGQQIAGRPPASGQGEYVQRVVAGLGERFSGRANATLAAHKSPRSSDRVGRRCTPAPASTPTRGVIGGPMVQQQSRQ